MINAFKESIEYKRRLKDLNNRYSNCLEQYSTALREAKDNKPGDIKKILAERDADCLEYEFQLKKHISNHLLAKARKRYVQRPDINNREMWEEQFLSEYFVLSEKGIAEIDSAILRKQKERMQVWVPLISALTGLIAALIGLIALFK